MKVGYSKTYPIALNGTWEKIWLEDEIASGSEEEVRKAQYALKKQVENFHYESKAAAEKQMGTQIVDEDKPRTLTQVADLIKEINFCKDWNVLEKTYKYIAATDTDLQHAYDLKRAELRQKEMKQILEKTEAKTKK